MGSCPCQCIPSNQPTSYTSRPLSRCLDSLPPYHLNPYYNSSLHCRNWWAYAFLHRLNGSDHVGVGRSVLRGEWGESSLRVICPANHVLWVFSNECHTLKQGRLHLGLDNRSLAQVM